MGNPSWGKGYHTGWGAGHRTGLGKGLAIGSGIGLLFSAIVGGLSYKSGKLNGSSEALTNKSRKTYLGYEEGLTSFDEERLSRSTS